MTKDEQLRNKAYEEIAHSKTLVNSDPYRLHYHVMPPVGLLNDPNGFIHWNGTYHLFYQWMPFKTDHGAKFWGHYSTKDFVTWKHEEIALTPSEPFEKNGCYSGSAIEHEGKLYIFYTGNVKDEQGNRETYQCLAISEDGISFEKKGAVVNLPDGYTPHFRDPKVWKQDNQYFMVVGAQTEHLNGAVALFQSNNLIDWNYEGILAGGEKGALQSFGYMFECPDLFKLGEKDVLLLSPQGIKAEGMMYQNVYQAGYIVGDFKADTQTYTIEQSFVELDRGFDFYAPQTTEDAKGRRLMFAWMSVPNQDEQDHPTIEHKWLHNMTIPRELKLREGKLFQLPVEELKALRIDDGVTHEVKLHNESKALDKVNGKVLELLIEQIDVPSGRFEISIRNNVRLIYCKEEKILTLERKSYVDGLVEKRQCQIDFLHTLHIYIDTSSIEVFVNGGQETFTARFYPNPNDIEIEFQSSKSSEFQLRKWSLAKVF